jgi:hypothetical protein
MDHTHVSAASPAPSDEPGAEAPPASGATLKPVGSGTSTGPGAGVDTPPWDPQEGVDPAVVAASGLTTRDCAILAFERRWWQYAGAKEQAIREIFDLSATRYYQVLNALIDRHEALAHDPMLVKRLRRLRTERQRQRSARRLGVRL